MALPPLFKKQPSVNERAPVVFRGVAVIDIGITIVGFVESEITEGLGCGDSDPDSRPVEGDGAIVIVERPRRVRPVAAHIHVPQGAVNVPELRVKVPLMVREVEEAVKVPVLVEKLPLTAMLPEEPVNVPEEKREVAARPVRVPEGALNAPELMVQGAVDGHGSAVWR